MTCELSVNLNAIAMLRNRRDLPWPSVVGMGRSALQAGAVGLTVHPRPDQRHIRFCDLPDLRALIDDEFPDAEFNIEGYPSDDFLALCEANEPEQVTLVPDDPSQSTSDHGWQVKSEIQILEASVKRLKENNFRVAIFVDPDASLEDLELAKQIGVDRVELYTGPYGGCFDAPEKAKIELAKLEATAAIAQEIGLGLNAGHDLSVDNLPALLAIAPHILECSIGHGLTAEALEFGMAGAVKRFLSVMKT